MLTVFPLIVLLSVFSNFSIIFPAVMLSVFRFLAVILRLFESMFLLFALCIIYCRFNSRFFGSDNDGFVPSPYSPRLQWLCTCRTSAAFRNQRRYTEYKKYGTNLGSRHLSTNQGESGRDAEEGDEREVRTLEGGAKIQIRENQIELLMKNRKKNYEIGRASCRERV